MRPSCIFLGLVLPITTVSSTCLENAIPAGERRNITIDGKQMPFGVYALDWASALFWGEMTKTIAEEVLGINTIISAYGGSSARSVDAIAGCHDGFKCVVPEDVVSRHHVSLESWYVAGTRTAEKYWAETNAIRSPIDLGTVGYEGTEGQFFPSSVKEDAINAQGLDLQYYANYNASWFKPGKYFDRITEFSDMLPCDNPAGLFVDADRMSVYDKHFSDVDPDGGEMRTVNGMEIYTATCTVPSAENPMFWASPACRANPDECVPVILANDGWGGNDILQRATYWNMPIVIGHASSWGETVRIGTTKKVMVYWWIPDTTFAESNMIKLTFPAYDQRQHEDGLGVTDSKDVELKKWAHRDLESTAPFLWTTIRNMKITMKEMMIELKKMDPINTRTDSRNVACGWLKENKDIWETWIPIATACSPGAGLVTSAGTFTSEYSSASACEACEPGFYSFKMFVQDQGRGFDTHYCSICTVGRAQAGYGQTRCDPCVPGLFANTNGSSLCDGCGLGKFTEEFGKTACENCSAGKYASTTGNSVCLECRLGTASDEGQAECGLCQNGKFANTTGMRECLSCEDEVHGSTTSNRAAQSAEECGCNEGEYEEGTGTSAHCINCPEGMICAFGADSNAGAAVYPVLRPMYWSSASDPLNVYRCDSDKRCPGGEPGNCGKKLHEQACAHCEDGFAWNGEACVACTSVETSKIIFPTLPILLLPIFIGLLYKFFGDKYEKWNSWQNGTSSVIFICLNHYQIISLARGANIDMPSEVGLVWDVFQFTGDASTVFNPDCAGFSNIQTSMIMKLIAPVVVAVIFVATVFMSRALAKLLKKPPVSMTKDRTLNVYFGLIFTFFAGIAAMAFAIFKCSPNPNTQKTLTVDRSVTCYESDWNNMLVIGLLSVFLWCIGFGSVFVRTVYVAPMCFADEGFQMRWKFLFIKFRPDTYWYSLIVIAKGIFMNLGFAILTIGVAQIYWLMILIPVYLGLCILCRPWRHMTVNAFDIYAHFSLILALSALSWFAKNETEDIEKLDKDMSNIVIAFSFTSLPIAIPILWQIIYVRTSPTYQKQLQKIAGTMHSAVQRLAKVQDFSDRVVALSEWDFWFMHQATTIIGIELLGFHVKSYRCATKELKKAEQMMKSATFLPQTEASPSSEPSKDFSFGQQVENGGNCENGENNSKEALDKALLDVEVLDAVLDMEQLSSSLNMQTPVKGSVFEGLITPRSGAATPLGVASPRIASRPYGAVTPTALTPRGGETPRDNLTPRE